MRAIGSSVLAFGLVSCFALAAAGCAGHNGANGMGEMNSGVGQASSALQETKAGFHVVVGGDTKSGLPRMRRGQEQFADATGQMQDGMGSMMSMGQCQHKDMASMMGAMDQMMAAAQEMHDAQEAMQKNPGDTSAQDKMNHGISSGETALQTMNGQMAGGGGCGAGMGSAMMGSGMGR